MRTISKNALAGRNGEDTADNAAALYERLVQDQRDWLLAIGLLTVTFSQLEHLLDSAARAILAREGHELVVPRQFSAKIKLLRKNCEDPQFLEYLLEAERIAEVRHWFTHGRPTDLLMTELETALVKINKTEQENQGNQIFEISEVESCCIDCLFLNINLMLYLIYELEIANKSILDGLLDSMRNRTTET